MTDIKRYLQWTLAILAIVVFIALVYSGGSEYGFWPMLGGLIIGISIVVVKLYMMGDDLLETNN